MEPDQDPTIGNHVEDPILEDSEDSEDQTYETARHKTAANKEPSTPKAPEMDKEPPIPKKAAKPSISLSAKPFSASYGLPAPAGHISQPLDPSSFQVSQCY